MTDTRTPRKTTTRETETRRKPWAPPSRLAAPDAPQGFVHRWIRTSMRGEDDKMSLSGRTSTQSTKHLQLTKVDLRESSGKVD